jgi:hypothetical protein
MTYYRSPDWINISFYRNTHYLDMTMASPTPPPNPNQDINVDMSHIYDEKPNTQQYNNDFEPTCRMPNLVRMDLSHVFGNSGDTISWPPIKFLPVSSEMSNHDDAVFRLERRRKKKPIRPSTSHVVISQFGTPPANLDARPIDIEIQTNGTQNGATPPTTTTISPRKSPRVKQPRTIQPQVVPKSLYNPFVLDTDRSDDVTLSLQQKNQTNTFHRRRWAHLHPTGGVRPTQKSEYIRHFLLNINWQSLTEPACLPLTTDYWPGAALTNSEEFILNNYNVTDQGNYENNLDMFIRELVQQRLHEGYQLYVPPQQAPANALSITTNVTPEPSQSKSPPSSSATPKKTPPKTIADDSTQNNEPTSYFLCSANQFHNISCNRYNRNLVVISTYQYISEEQRRAKQQKETVQPQAFHYRYMLWNSTVDRFEARGNIRFKAHVGEYLWNKLDYLICGEHRDMNYDLHNRALQFHLIPISNSNRNYFNYPNTTMLLSSSSSLLNSGVISGGPISVSPLTTQPTRIDQKTELETRVASFKKFFDGITGRTFRLPVNGEESLDIAYADPASYLEPELYAETTLKQAASQDQTMNDAREIPHNRVTKMERILTEEGERYEWIHLHHKKTYHPMETFVFSIRWLVCSSVHIDDYLQALTRRAKQCGFALVQTPIDTNFFTKPRSNRRSAFFQQQQKQQDEMKMKEMGVLIQERVFHDGSRINPDFHPFRSFVNISLHSDEAIQMIKSKVLEPPFNVS